MTRARAYFLLFLLVSVRLILCLWTTKDLRAGQKLDLLGNVDKTYQKGAMCIYNIGKYRLEIRDRCLGEVPLRIEFVGSYKPRLIDRALGLISLVDGQIIGFEQNEFRAGFGSSLNRLSNTLMTIIEKCLDRSEAGLVAGLVLGKKDLISKAYYQRLINAGLVHVVVASGYNVMLVGSIVLNLLLVLFPRRLATMTMLVSLGLYAALVGWQAPIVRATLMAVILFIGKAWGRSVDVLWTLLVSTVIMFLISPEIVIEIGFQLSVGSCLGLFVIEPWLRKKWPWKSMIIDNSELLATFSTMVVTLPMVWFYFGRVSVLGLISNIIVLPMVPLITILGALMVLVGLVNLPMAVLLSLPTIALAKMVTFAVEVFGG